MTWRKVGVMSLLPGVEAPVFSRPVADGFLRVIVGQEPVNDEGRVDWHLSISHASNLIAPSGVGMLPGRIPTWDEIKEARYRFIPDEVNMAMMLPPKRLYINMHRTTMHLWEIPMEYAGGDKLKDASLPVFDGDAPIEVLGMDVKTIEEMRCFAINHGWKNTH